MPTSESFVQTADEPFSETGSRLGASLVELCGAPSSETCGRGRLPTVDRAIPVASQPQDERDDQRAFPRHVGGDVIVSVCSANSATDDPVEIDWKLHTSARPATLVDVSMRGVAFLCDKPIPPGRELLVRLKNRRLDGHVDGRATVLRALSVESGGWKIVCRFRRPLSFAQVHELGRQVFSSNLV